MTTIDGPNSITLLPPKVVDTSEISKSAAGFGDMLTSMMGKVSEKQNAGDQAIEKLQSGEAKHLHEVMIAVEEADISLRMLVQMRNKALTAYEEIMRMQI
ncbi:MAG: flagellar hook-basal body complex protein FliE [Desulforhopalus sp.]|jgi:flagellar hook-basal body complex protein FliE|nr:flagellar hook-basal body complex protein FliE [Desulforhopalus sp.]